MHVIRYANAVDDFKWLTVGRSDDGLAGSVASMPVRTQPHLAVSSNQYDHWPSVRCLSLQYPSNGQVTSWFCMHRPVLVLYSICNCT